jgi:uncharacterized protein YjdB
VQLTAQARDGAGSALSGHTITFSSSNTAVATVSNAGLVTAVAAGTASITASSEQKTSAPLSVTVDPLAATVTVLPGALTFGTKGRTIPLTPDVRDSAGSALTGKTIVWASLNTAVATVNGSGVVSSVADGSTNVTATVDGQVATTPVNVALVTATVALGQSAIAFGAKGSAKQATFSARDSLLNPIPGRTAAWTSSDTTVFTVDTTGLAVSKGLGNARLRVAVDGVTDSAAVSVTFVPAHLAVSPDTVIFRTHGRTAQIVTTVRDSNQNVIAGLIPVYTNRNLGTWSVSGSGLLTDLYNGSGNVIVQVGGLTDSVFVNSLLYMTGVTLSRPLAFGQLFATDTVSVVLMDSAGVAPHVAAAAAGSWTVVSRDPSIAMANQIGFGQDVESIKSGATYLVATTNSGAMDSILITVQQVPAAVTMPPFFLQVGAIGSNFQASGIVRDSGGTALVSQPPLTFSGTGHGFATVSASGLITSLANGTDSAIATTPGPSAVVGYLPIAVAQVPAVITLSSSSTTHDSLFTTGRSVQFTASAADSNGHAVAAPQLTWDMTNNGPFANADFTVSGLVATVVAQADGTDTVHAHSAMTGALGSRQVFIQLYASTFTISPSGPLTIGGTGTTQNLTGTVQDSVAAALPVAWVSRNAAIVAVSPTNTSVTTATTHAPGSTYIVLTGGQRADSVAVTVTP